MIKHRSSARPARSTLVRWLRERPLTRHAGIAIGVLAVAGLAGQPARADIEVTQTNLVTDNQAVNTAAITDPDLQNPWGVSFSPTSPFWISDNNDGLSTLYSVNPTTNAVSKVALTVTIPPGGGNGSPDGQVSNTNAAAFNGDNFLFVSEDGTISGWRGALGTTAQTLQAPTANNGNVYKGTALGTVNGTEFLYAANFKTGNIDVIAGSGTATITGRFTDPNGLPPGYAPFNIQNIGGKLYVSYALQDAAKHDDVAGAGNGYVDEYDLNGNFIARIATKGTLNSPWGMTIAPASLGSLAGDLLVGNFGNGEISAFNLANDTFAGMLDGPDGNPLVIPELWDLTPGNGTSAGSTQDLFFTAGPNDQTDGVFGVLTNAPEPASVSLLGIGLGGILLARRRRRMAG
jgi:uncharacterized protein (TIGR03118 family)